MVFKRYWALERGELSTEAVCPLCHLTDRQVTVPGSRRLWLPSSPTKHHLHLSIHIHSCTLPVIFASLSLLCWPNLCHSAGDEWPGMLGGGQALNNGYSIVYQERPAVRLGNLSLPKNTDSWETHTIKVWKMVQKKGSKELSKTTKEMCFSSNSLHGYYYLWLSAITTSYSYSAKWRT